MSHSQFDLALATIRDKLMDLEWESDAQMKSARADDLLRDALRAMMLRYADDVATIEIIEEIQTLYRGAKKP